MVTNTILGVPYKIPRNPILIIKAALLGALKRLGV